MLGTYWIHIKQIKNTGTYVYIYIYICTHAMCVSKCICACMHAGLHVCLPSGWVQRHVLSVCLPVCNMVSYMDVCMHVHKGACLHLQHRCLSPCVYTYTSMQASKQASMHPCIHTVTYIHKHTHTPHPWTFQESHANT